MFVNKKHSKLTYRALSLSSSAFSTWVNNIPSAAAVHTEHSVQTYAWPFHRHLEPRCAPSELHKEGNGEEKAVWATLSVTPSGSKQRQCD